MNYTHSNGFIEAARPTKNHRFFHSYVSSKWSVTQEELARIEADIALEGVTPREVRIVRELLPSGACYADVWLL